MRANYQPDLARGFVALDADDYQTVLDVNLTGTISRCSRASARCSTTAARRTRA